MKIYWLKTQPKNSEPQRYKGNFRWGRQDNKLSNDVNLEILEYLITSFFAAQSSPLLPIKFFTNSTWCRNNFTFFIPLLLLKFYLCNYRWQDSTCIKIHIREYYQQKRQLSAFHNMTKRWSLCNLRCMAYPSAQVCAEKVILEVSDKSLRHGCWQKLTSLSGNVLLTTYWTFQYLTTRI